VFGVLPLYYGEMVGGWSQEGLQVTITNRAVKWGQDILYKSFFRKFAEVMGVNDWDLKLVAGEENDKLRLLQQDGVEIQNMSLLQQMGFTIERTHTGEYNISKDTHQQEELKLGRGRGTASPEENRQQFSGEPTQASPSDLGGIAQGHPASGSGTSMSKKNYPDGITPQNYYVVKKTLQSAIDFGWKKTKTVDELRKWGVMTVRDARELVKNEFGNVRRWEDDDSQESN
jgi:hypothetical protein